MKLKLEERYRDFWKESINLQPKMRSYVTFKSSFGLEQYLDQIKFRYRRALCQLRISAHPLLIEKGRYTSPKTPVEKRICQVCTVNEVEDEQHFVTMCTAYSSQRAKVYNDIDNKCPLFRKLSNNQKFIYMVTAEDDILYLSSRFIYDCFQVRKNTTS